MQSRYEKLKASHKKATDAIIQVEVRLDSKVRVAHSLAQACLLISSTSSTPPGGRDGSDFGGTGEFEEEGTGTQEQDRRVQDQD